MDSLAHIMIRLMIAYENGLRPKNLMSLEYQKSTYIGPESTENYNSMKDSPDGGHQDKLDDYLHTIKMKAERNVQSGSTEARHRYADMKLVLENKTEEKILEVLVDGCGKSSEAKTISP